MFGQICKCIHTVDNNGPKSLSILNDTVFCIERTITFEGLKICLTVCDCDLSSFTHCLIIQFIEPFPQAARLVLFYFSFSFNSCIISVALSAAEPGLSVDTDAQVGAQSGAAPTAEGRIITSHLV